MQGRKFGNKIFFILLFLVIFTQAQTCGPLQHYVDTHQSCHINGNSCSGLSCYDNSTDISFTVQKCEDPVTVDVYIMESSKKREPLSYQFKRSETMNTEFNTFTAIMDRNTSHLGFKVYTYIHIHNQSAIYTCTCIIIACVYTMIQ